MMTLSLLVVPFFKCSNNLQNIAFISLILILQVRKTQENPIDHDVSGCFNASKAPFSIAFRLPIYSQAPHTALAQQLLVWDWSSTSCPLQEIRHWNQETHGFQPELPRTNQTIAGFAQIFSFQNQPENGLAKKSQPSENLGFQRQTMRRNHLDEG